jgi:hypothetical protein
VGEGGVSAPATTRLHPENLKTIVELLREELGGVRAELAGLRQELAEPREGLPMGDDFLTANELADRIGRSAEWVRDHKFDLGVILLGDGPKPRQLYSFARALEGMSKLASQHRTPTEAPKSRPRRRRPRPTSGVDLLPIRGRDS